MRSDLVERRRGLMEARSNYLLPKEPKQFPVNETRGIRACPVFYCSTGN